MLSFHLALFYTEFTYVDVLIQDTRQRKKQAPFVDKAKAKAEIWFIS